MALQRFIAAAALMLSALACGGNFDANSSCPALLITAFDQAKRPYAEESSPQAIAEMLIQQRLADDHDTRRRVAWMVQSRQRIADDVTDAQNYFATLWPEMEKTAQNRAATLLGSERNGDVDFEASLAIASGRSPHERPTSAAAMIPDQTIGLSNRSPLENIIGATDILNEAFDIRVNQLLDLRNGEAKPTDATRALTGHLGLANSVVVVFRQVEPLQTATATAIESYPELASSPVLVVPQVLLARRLTALPLERAADLVRDTTRSAGIHPAVKLTCQRLHIFGGGHGISGLRDFLRDQIDSMLLHHDRVDIFLYPDLQYGLLEGNPVQRDENSAPPNERLRFQTLAQYLGEESISLNQRVYFELAQALVTRTETTAPHSYFDSEAEEDEGQVAEIRFAKGVTTYTSTFHLEADGEELVSSGEVRVHFVIP